MLCLIIVYGLVSHILFQLQTISLSVHLGQLSRFQSLSQLAIDRLCVLMEEPSHQTNKAEHNWCQAAGCLLPKSCREYEPRLWPDAISRRICRVKSGLNYESNLRTWLCFIYRTPWHDLTSISFLADHVFLCLCLFLASHNRQLAFHILSCSPLLNSNKAIPWYRTCSLRASALLQRQSS